MQTRVFTTAMCTLMLAALFSLTSIAGPSATGQGRTLQALDEPRPAPRFELPGIDGKQYKLDGFRGKYLLVNFWAVWCAPCRQEMPSLESAYRQLRGERFEMLAIHVGPSLENAARVSGDLALSFPVAVDERVVLSDWPVRGLPTTYLLDPAGMIIASAIGERDWDSPQMMEALNNFLDQRDR